jgi:DNA polymerase-4
MDLCSNTPPNASDLAPDPAPAGFATADQPDTSAWAGHHDHDQVRHLFLDLNSYFASVEQHLEPALRGRPVAVAPVRMPTGACIAASYEAKRFGVKTGTKVAEALRLCPEIVLVSPRHRVYVEYHHRVIEAVERCAPVEAVHSIDEMSIRLGRGQRTAAGAVALAMAIKRSIAARVGPTLTCSIGIAPNRVIAKVASDMVKPDGLVVIEKRELPERLFDLSLRDLPGVGPSMEARLVRRGIRTIEDLARLDVRELERAWESVLGSRWWHALRGDDLLEAPSRRRSIGHQHVLAPRRRTDALAWEVAARLLHKAAARARSLGYFATRLSLAVRTLDGRRFDETRKFAGGTQDTLELQHALASMWSRRRREASGRGTPLLVSVTLHDLVHGSSATLPLFAQEQNRRALSLAMDEVNTRAGRVTLYLGAMHEARDDASGGIAFRSIPDLALPDTVRNRSHVGAEGGMTARGRTAAARSRAERAGDARSRRAAARENASHAAVVRAIGAARRGEAADEPRVVPVDDEGRPMEVRRERDGPGGSRGETRGGGIAPADDTVTGNAPDASRRRRALGGFGTSP